MGTLHEDLCIYDILLRFGVEWELFQTKVVEETKTHILYSITLSRKSCHLWDNMKK
jgi:hypothetical protein